MGFIERIGGTKTLKLVIGTCLGAVGGVLADKIEWAEAAILIVNALGWLFVRDGIEKKKS